MKVSYKWLQTYFEDGALPSVVELEQKLMFHAFEIEGVEKVENDSVIDVDVLPNRAADCLSHRGIAKEISILFNIPINDDPLKKEISLVPTTDKISVSLDKDASCSYYASALIKGVKVAESPKWLKESLEAIGQKSINNVVDATNYVLFGLGQPTHVFDAQKFSGDNPKIGVRLAKEGENIELLGGTKVDLTNTMSVITDANNDTPLAVAGVKGGTVAEVSEQTTDIIIESAKFNAVQTRKTSQALKIRTDASARYENNVASKLAQYGVQAVAELILEIAGGELIGFTQKGELDQNNKTVNVQISKVSKLLGVEINKEQIEDILQRLQFEYKFEGNGFDVKAPFERRDINIPEDVIEEIGRVYGYFNIESKQLDAPEKQPGMNQKFAYSEIIRDTLNKLDFTEVYLYSLRDSGEIKLLNSLASDKDHLRANLKDGIVESLDKNEKQMPLLGLYNALKIFEIGNVFTKDSENTNVCLGVRVLGKKKKKERTLEILNQAKDALETALGCNLPESIGETLEFDLSEIIKDLPKVDNYINTNTVSDDVAYTHISQYPFVLRDIAIWAPSGTKDETLTNIIKEHGGDLVQRVDKFDEFEKDGKVSLAFHTVFQAGDKTLTDKEVNTIMQKVEDIINNTEGFQVR